MIPLKNIKIKLVSMAGILLCNMIIGYSQPAARVGDMHTCPMSSSTIPPVPHAGGPILPPGCQTVLIGGKPAARVGDLASCVGATDAIASGCTTVLIGGKPAATMGDPTTHGGKITEGYPTVLIGTIKGGLPDSKSSDNSRLVTPEFLVGMIRNSTNRAVTDLVTTCKDRIILK